MAKTTFKKPEATAPAATEVEVLEPVSDTLAEPTNPETAVVPYQPNADFTGSWSRSDVRYPRINLVQKSSDSKLINAFGIGAFVFNREVKLSDGKTPLFITAVQLDKDFQQKLPWGSKEEPVVCRTPEEVRKVGGTLTYKGAKPGTYFQPRAHITLILQMPEGISADGETLFPYEFNGKCYSIALITVSSSGFTSMAKEIATLCTFNKVMRKGSIFGQLQLTSEERSDATKEWYVPIVKFDEAHSDETLKFFESLRGVN
jgi:hypothetical protein